MIACKEEDWWEMNSRAEWERVASEIKQGKQKQEAVGSERVEARRIRCEQNCPSMYHS